ncbi:MAG: hypothetical protein M1409_00755 [Actinobacteria bacterium]|nr:hypothetical protein [Actinomycetota bacterium]
MMILAGTGTDKFTLKEAISKFVKIKDRFEPDKNIRTRYVDKFEKYKKYTVLFLSFINSHRKVLSSLINKNMFNIKQFNF